MDYRKELHTTAASYFQKQKEEDLELHQVMREIQALNADRREERAARIAANGVYRDIQAKKKARSKGKAQRAARKRSRPNG